jgi:hypothetical protein
MHPCFYFFFLENLLSYPKLVLKGDVRILDIRSLLKYQLGVIC